MKKIMMPLGVLALFIGGWLYAASLAFEPHELFQVGFGEGVGQLGLKLENGNLMVPRDFTLDSFGHVYINDIHHHRIMRFTMDGKYQMAFRYVPTAGQLFAHADSHENLWLLISDPVQGMYYGVYDSHGKQLRSGVFTKFNRFELHPDDANVLHIILTSTKDPQVVQTYLFDEESLLMKKENIPRPPDAHHQIRHSDKTYFIDQVPGGSGKSPVNRVTDEAHHGVAEIEGDVLYMTGRGEIYTRVHDCEVRIYDATGKLEGKVALHGTATMCQNVRFDGFGNIYELDGIPNASGAYNAQMPGMRLIEWEHP